MVEINQLRLGKRYEYDGQPSRPLNNLQHKVLELIKKKIESGEYMFGSIKCPICGKNDFETLAMKDRYGLYNPVAICRSCGLIQSNPRMTQTSFYAFYVHEYRNLYHSGKNEAIDIFNDEYKRGLMIYEYLKDLNLFDKELKNKFVFEIGCGAGGILKAFRDMGFKVAGIDIDKKLLLFGKIEQGLDLKDGTLHEASFHKTPDLIILSHTLEHILDPIKDLSVLHKIIKMKSLIYIEVPGVRYLRRGNYDFLDTLQNAHLYYFTLTSLKNLLINNGFSFVKGNEFIRCIFRKGQKSGLKIINEYQKTMKFLLRIEKERLLFPIPPFKLIRNVKFLFNSLRSLFYKSLTK
jgi:2-polyprenyl-3-methyl-5-hydroxy-6-metoxy-1,4-benzoquinol methylase